MKNTTSWGEYYKNLIRADMLMDTVDKVIEWASARNLILGATTHAQMLKLTEEVGELAGGIAKSKPEVIKDSIGDSLVVLIILAAQHGLTIEECLMSAYDEIKDRKGKMVNGVFVKDGG